MIQDYIVNYRKTRLDMDWDSVLGSDDEEAGSVLNDGRHLHGGEYTDSAADALMLCLNRYGRVDMKFISSRSGLDTEEAAKALRGILFQDPEVWNEDPDQGWVTSDEYLSGNIAYKLEYAEKAVRVYGSRFSANVEALRKVLPPELSYGDIYVTLGSPWVPPDVIDDFIEHLFGVPSYYSWNPTWREMLKTRRSETTGIWNIPDKNRYYYSVAVNRTFGTMRINALQILEKTLNMKTITVMDEVACTTNKSGIRRVINRKETLAAIEKQNALIKAFQEWIWKDPERANRIRNIFMMRYGCITRRRFDGSFLEFPDMSDSVSLYKYQEDAVARIIMTPNTLLAHDVGAGKTYIMAAAGHELIRMGISSKNMYVVPNNIVGQWEKIYHEMYPAAKLLIVEPKTFSPKKRQKMLEKMRDGSCDAIIIAYSCFDMIPLSRQYYIDELNEKKEKVLTALSMDRRDNDLYRQKEKIDKKLKEIENTDKWPGKCGIYFDELHVTRLFVDEADHYKNVPVETGTSRILGISRTGSAKCKSMLDKVHLVQKENNGGGIVFATGTPITNSLTDVFVMQKYLQDGELQLLDLGNFDSWIGMFAEKVTEFEIDVDTSSYRLATRFSKFHNLPELTALLAQIADFHSQDKSSGIPDFDGYEDKLIRKTYALEVFLKEISKRADDVRNGRIGAKDDNMLKITTDGRKGALDIRLVMPDAPVSPWSKVSTCVDNVSGIYQRTSDILGTQLIFCDISTPKAGFNVYDEVKKGLIANGIPADEIAFVHEADTEKKRAILFGNVRTGRIRVLLGSTMKLGLGVNVQDRLVAVHHIDVPWRPADMTQREGRILRPGNMNKKIHIYRYVTEGSFDAYSWQLLETKQRFIDRLLSGSLTERSGSDVDDVVLSYAEIKALAVNDPTVKQRVEAENEMRRYITLQNKVAETRISMEQELSLIPGKIAEEERHILNCKDDIAFVKDHPERGDARLSTAEQESRREHRKELRERIWSMLAGHTDAPDEEYIDSYRGFDVLAPSYMTDEKPFVWIERKGKYPVELGKSDKGVLIRIDNCLNELDTVLDRHISVLADLKKQECDIRAELDKDENYTDDIRRCEVLIAELDEKLGVNKK